MLTSCDPQMLAHLEKNLPEVRVSQSPSCRGHPSGDSSYDIAVCGEAFHWFDVDRALPEIARVLKPRGRLSLVWNQRDERIPWVKRLGAIIGTQDQLREPAREADRGHRLFGEVEAGVATRSGSMHRPRLSIQRPGARSRSNVAVLGAAESGGQAGGGASRSTTTSAAAWTACSCRTPPAASAHRSSTALTPTLTDRRSAEDSDGAVSDGSSTDMLLIDFH